MSDLFAPLVSIASTKRRRFFWAAYWSGPPTESPFRAPDAHSGGARTEAEAKAEAEARAGMPLVVVSAKWARAVQRTLLGQPPFLPPKKPKIGPNDAERPSDLHGVSSVGARPSVWALLGIDRHATDEQLKRAFREKALATHPDRGGTAEAFREIHAAYVEAKKRLAKPQRAVPRRA